MRLSYCNVRIAFYKLQLGSEHTLARVFKRDKTVYVLHYVTQYPLSSEEEQAWIQRLKAVNVSVLPPEGNATVN